MKHQKTLDIQFPFCLSEDEVVDFLHHFNGAVALTVSEDENFFYVKCALPGVGQEGIILTFEEPFLWITTDKNEDSEDAYQTFTCKAESDFVYRVDIPTSVDLSAIPDTLYKNGMLKIKLPKKSFNNE